MSSLSFSELDQHIGSWLALVDADEQVLVGKLTNVEPFDYKDTKGVYADIGGTQFEFCLDDQWCSIYKVDTNDIESIIAKAME